MKARIGDRIVVGPQHIDGERRIGIITAIGHDDGSPPYRVRWLIDGRTTLFYPGPDARIEPGHGSTGNGS